LRIKVARTIMEMHGGLITLNNRPTGGCRATLILKAIGD
jgi:hypothetical protein